MRYPKNRHYNPSPAPPSGGGGGSNYISTEITLSSAQIKTLTTSPVVLIPAPGPGLIIIPRYITYHYDFGTIPYASVTTMVIYEVPGDHLGDAFSFAGAADKILACGLESGATGYAYNAALIAYSSLGDPSAGDGTIKIKVEYTIESL